VHHDECKTLLVLTSREERDEDVEWFGMTGKIKFIPMLKWLEADDVPPA
jgi:hypothetical protein